MVDVLLDHMDVSLIWGHRTRAQQDTFYRSGHSKVKWPDSKHNKYPSLAVDIQPYPYPENENDLRAALGYMAGLCWMIADSMGVEIRWGGDWNRNGSVVDNGFDDLFHLEIYEQ
jgi:peptidoglycan L-alanyl-D-glutamate endopeptidase CwlK